MATTVTANSPQTFPAGTVVSIYPYNGGLQGQKPSGTALKTATVEASGKLKVEGLTAETMYWAVAEVSGEWRYLLLGTPEDPVAPAEESASETAVTLKPSERFPIATSVGAYPANSRVPGAHPVGPSLVEAQEVDATGKLKFEGLTGLTEYQAAAEVGGTWRYLRFGTTKYVEPPTFLLDRIRQQRALVGA